MPFIQCDLEQGLSDAEKVELVRKMVEVTHKAIGSAREHINVVSVNTRAQIWVKRECPIED